MTRPITLTRGTVARGNWGGGVHAPKRKGQSLAYLSRNLNGRIDEFALLGRALSVEEIRAYYQEGRVATGVLMARKSGS